MSGREVNGWAKKKESSFWLPAALEMLLFLIPLMILGGWYLHVLMENRFLKNELVQYRQLTEQCVAAEIRRLSGMSDLSGGGKELPEQADLRELFGGKDTLEIDGVNDPRFFYLAAGADGSRIRADVRRGEILPVLPETEVFKLMEQALLMKGIVTGNIRSESAEYRSSVVAVPVRTPVWFGGEKILEGKEGDALVICCGIDYGAVKEECHNLTWKAGRQIFLGFGVVILILSFLIVRALRALKPMQRMMEELEQGKNPETAEASILRAMTPGSRDEVAELTETFLRMAGTIREYTENVGGIHGVYSPFLPDSLLEFFGKEDMREIVPGDKVEIYGDFLRLEFEDADASGPASGERNRVIGEAADAIMKNGGIVLSLDMHQVAGVFPLIEEDIIEEEPESEEPEELSEVIESAKSPVIQAAEAAAGISLAGSGIREIHAGITRRNSLLMVIGASSRMAIRMDPGMEEAFT